MVKVQKDEVGNKYGKLTVVSRADDHISPSGNKYAMWNCKCDCGNPNLITVLGASLRNGNTKSCGCYAKELANLRMRKSNLYWQTDDCIVGYCYNAKSFKIDIEDYELVKDYSWSVNKQGYVRTQDCETKEDILLHRLVTHCPEDLVVDHDNHITTDNRKSNLIICTQSENMQNTNLRSDNKSGCKGVSWCNERQKWIAQFKVNKQLVLHKRFDTYEEAVRARKEAEEKYSNRLPQRGERSA